MTTELNDNDLSVAIKAARDIYRAHCLRFRRIYPYSAIKSVQDDNENHDRFFREDVEAAKSYDALRRLCRQQKHNYDKIWKAANHDRLMLQGKAYRAANREQCLESISLWYRAHPDKVRQYNARRRARAAGTTGSFTSEEFLELCSVFEYRCAYCGIESKSLCADHATPLSRGGSDCIDNILPACSSCNSSKGTKTVAEFLAARTPGVEIGPSWGEMEKVC